MNRIGLNHWYLEGNELSISLLNFYVEINILKNNQFIYFQTKVKDNEEKELTYNFYAIEDAISFTEKVVANCQNTKEVLVRYGEMFENDKFKSPDLKKKKEEESKIILTPDEVDQAIIGYFSEGKEYKVSIQEELLLNQDQLDLKFYLIEYLDYDGIKKDVKTMLTNGDLKKALNHYINFYNYELVDFKYIGGIHRVGYYFDEDTPHYDGIELKVVPKVKEKMLSKNI